MPEVRSEYYARIVHTAKEFLAEKDYTIIIKLTDFSASKMVESINAMSRIRVKCLLMVIDTEEIISEQIVRTLDRSGLPVMLITSKHYPLLEYDCIHLDEYSGIVMGIQHLLSRGYRRIGCISDKVSANRVTIYRQALKRLGIKLDAQMVCVGNERGESGGYLRMKELLSMPSRPDAVFCCYDQMAIGCHPRPAQKAGCAFPRTWPSWGLTTSRSRAISRGASPPSPTPMRT